MTDDIKRTTIFLTAEQHEALRRLAFEGRTTIADLIRRAIDEKYGPFEDSEVLRGKEAA